jgi:hypothetical protein
VEITHLMSFKQFKMLNSASKCLKIPLNVKLLNIQNQKKKIDGGSLPHVKFMPGVSTPSPHCMKPCNLVPSWRVRHSLVET